MLLRPLRDPVLETTDLDGELVVMRLATGEVLVLNATATAIWWLCDGSVTPAEMTAVLADRFGGDPAVVGKDVDATLTRLINVGFVTDGRAGAAPNSTP